WILPVHSEGSVTIHLGYGRKRGGRAASGYGFNAYLLLASHEVPGVEIRKTGKHWDLACTELQQTMNGRDPVRRGSFTAPPSGDKGDVLTLAPQYQSPYEAWAMSIDLSACIGCK